jgi:hypothetical protein
MVVFLAASGISVRTSPRSTKHHPTPLIDIQEWVRQTISNEIKQQAEDHTLWAYRELIQRDGTEELREICQTNIGEINRLVALNRRPLSAEQQRKEDQRIQELLAEPEEVRKQQQKRDEDVEEGRRMLELFPKAFHYESAGTEGDLIKITFSPDPYFEPSTRQQEVLRHVEGIMWINTQQKRVARLDGRLVSDVKFLGGILGSLNKGGSFYLREDDVGSGHWEMVGLDIQIRGRAFLFRTISVQERRELSRYREVPANLTLQQGAELLRQDAIIYDQTLAKNEQQ